MRRLLPTCSPASTAISSGRRWRSSHVHVPDEGSIEGTELAIPFDQVEAGVDEFPADRSTPLAVYCMSGRMSAIAVETLTELGYTNVIEFEGGMIAWQAEGRPLLPSAGS